MTKKELSLLVERVLESDKALGLLWDFKQEVVSQLDVDMNYALRAPVSNYILDYNATFDRGIKDAIVSDICDSYEEAGLLDS